MTRKPDQRNFLSRVELQNPYAYLNGEGGYDVHVQKSTAALALIDKDSLLKGWKRGRAFSRKEIACIARNLHTELWLRRTQIISLQDGVEPMEIVDPELALHAIGYSVALRESLGQHAAGKESFEVAGIVDNTTRKVEISRRFAPAIRHFTSAHELGHAILHETSGLHRDRALDGSSVGTRDLQEVEADAFASFFLLPEKQVRIAFRKRFLNEHFRPTDASAFALAFRSLADLQQRCHTNRELARVLAAAQVYNGVHFKSLADRFNVSVEVMAIRLEELNLLEPAR